MLALIIAVVAVAFVVITAFVFVSTAKRVIEAGVWCPWYVRLIAYLWLIVGIVADVLFNAFWGTLIFREFPRELLFTSRVKRHCRESASVSERRYKKACAWRDFLNAVDPGHIREVES